MKTIRLLIGLGLMKAWLALSRTELQHHETIVCLCGQKFSRRLSASFIMWHHRIERFSGLANR